MQFINSAYLQVTATIQTSFTVGEMRYFSNVFFIYKAVRAYEMLAISRCVGRLAYNTCLLQVSDYVKTETI